jgi:hypothetical protein
MVGYRIHASDRPTTHHLCHVTLSITPQCSTLGKRGNAAPPNTHISQRYFDSTTRLLVLCSPQIYNGSIRALFLADLHPLFHHMQEEGDACLDSGG